MVDSKIIDLLKTFSAKELNRFGEYLDSPFFNKREDLRQIYRLLQTFAPSFDSPQLSKENIAAQLNPGQPLSEKEINYLSNFLLKHAENFLAIQHIDADEALKSRFVLDHYLQHRLPKHYRSTLSRAQKALKKEPYRDAEWHLKAWRLADAEVQHFYSFKERRPEVSLEQSQAHLDAFYLDKRMEISSEVLNLRQILQAQLDSRHISPLLQYSAALDSQEPPVRMRQMILRILKDPEDDASFQALRQLLPQSLQFLPPDKVKGAFAYAQNFCIRRIKSGDLSYQQELFSLYQESLQAGVMYEEGKINPWNFKNVCSVALKLKAFSWVESFIEKHRSRLESRFRKNAVAYNRANLHFHQQNYSEAIRALQPIEFSDIFYALDTRRMLLMIYFERKDHDALESLLAAFRVFLRRNKLISSPNRKAYTQFVNLLGKLQRVRQEGSSLNPSDLEAEIRQSPSLVEAEWLLKKCKHLY